MSKIKLDNLRKEDNESLGNIKYINKNGLKIRITGIGIGYLSKLLYNLEYKGGE